MAHDHVVYDSDPHFQIDPDTRELKYTSPEKLTIMHNDHNSEIVTFDMPRYIDGHDMLLCNKIQVHFINIDGSKSSDRVSGMYTVTDAHEDPENDKQVIFSWPISRSATSLVGTLHFTLRFACMEGSKLTYAWNTAVYNGISVSPSIDNTETIGEEYTDIVYEWYYSLVSAGTMGVNAIADATEDAIARIALNGGVIVSDTEPTSQSVLLWINPNDTNKYVLRVRNKATGKFEAITSIQGEKGETGDINILNLVHTTGDDMSAAVSQYGFTRALGDVQGLIEQDVDAAKAEYRKAHREFVYSTRYSECKDNHELTYEHLDTADFGSGYIVTGVTAKGYKPLMIPSTYLGEPVIGIGAEFRVPSKISSITLPSTIKFLMASNDAMSYGYMGDGAFSGEYVDGESWSYNVIDCTMLDKPPEVVNISFAGYTNGIIANPTTGDVLSIGDGWRCIVRFTSSAYASRWMTQSKWDNLSKTGDVEFDIVDDKCISIWDEYTSGFPTPDGPDFSTMYLES